ALRMHAAPIQASATVQAMARTGTDTSSPAPMATLGIHHASRRMRGLCSQSRELPAMSLATALSGAAGRAVARGARRLDRWTGNRAVGAEDAAVARLRSQRRAAAGACVEEPARIGRHGF